VTAHATKQIITLKIDDPSDCGDKFRSNRALGALLFAGIIIGNLFKEEIPPAMPNAIT